MSQKLTALFAGALCLTLVWAPDAEARRINLKTNAGAMMVGGRIAIDIQSWNPGTPAGQNVQNEGWNAYTLQIEPEFGYFVANGFAIEAGLGFSTQFGDAFDNAVSTQAFSFKVGGKYIFPMGGPVRPYLGAGIGMRMVTNKATANNVTTSTSVNHLLIAIPIGIYVPLFTEYLALDVGVKLEIDMNLEDAQAGGQPGNAGGTLIHAPIGYLGVQGFFGR